MCNVGGRVRARAGRQGGESSVRRAGLLTSEPGATRRRRSSNENTQQRALPVRLEKWGGNPPCSALWATLRNLIFVLSLHEARRDMGKV